MIDRLSHVTLWVTDQDVAYDFYVNKLGFEVRTDNTDLGFRWLTVAPPNQKALEIVLMLLTPNPMMSEETVSTLRGLLEAGALASGVLTVDDCHRTYETLKARGVEFSSGPQQRPYGVEAILKDPFGNWFSMTQPHEPS